MHWYHNFKKLVGARAPIRIRAVVRPKVTVKKPVAVQPVKIKSNLIKYQMNDPTTPQLLKDVVAPIAMVNPKFSVSGYIGPGYELNTVAGQAANVYVTISNIIRNINLISTKKLTRWATAKTLLVIPRAGRMFNAYYDRRSLSFFYNKDRNNQEIYTSDSADIVAHELGHAILDSYRPDLWSIASLETWAFHEAFSDIISMLNLLSHGEAIQFILDQTGGDLRTPNAVSSIAEQFGATLFNRTSGRNAGWLRSAINPFIYSDPSRLPSSGPDDVLTKEPHSLSRVMLGTCYDIFLMMYDGERAKGVDAFNSVVNARNILAKNLLSSIQVTPNTSRFFQGMATTMLSVDQSQGGIYQRRLQTIFNARNLLQSGVSALSLTNPCCLRLCECQHIVPPVDNPLHEVEVEVPDSSIAAIIAAQQMVHYLHHADLVSSEHDTPFEVIDGKLVRTSFLCGCSSGCGRPSKFQPEYLKPQKPENHSGCGCRCGKNTQAVSSTPQVKRGCYIRYEVNR